MIYRCDILTDMKRKLITLDEKSFNLLASKPNASETIRNALEVYNGDISTDTLAGMRQAFRKTNERIDELETQVIYLIDMVEKIKSIMESHG